MTSRTARFFGLLPSSLWFNFNQLQNFPSNGSRRAQEGLGLSPQILIGRALASLGATCLRRDFTHVYSSRIVAASVGVDGHFSGPKKLNMVTLIRVLLNKYCDPRKSGDI